MFITRATIALAAALALPAAADDLHVPSQYPTIQAAVSASQAGDAIILADGQYTGDGNHDITMPAHAITLRSASGDPGVCVILMRDPELHPPERAFHFTPASSSDIVVRDIKLRGGSGGPGTTLTPVGGAVFINGSSPTFDNCVFERNTAYDECGAATNGGAVYLIDSSARFQGCDFISNLASGEPCGGVTRGAGGGVYIQSGSPHFTDCLFQSNWVDSSVFGPYAWGGGIHVAGGSVLLERVRFIRNRASGAAYGGALSVAGGEVAAVDCGFEGNVAKLDAYGGAVAMRGGRLDLVNCRIFGNVADSYEWGDSARGGAIYAEAGVITLTNSLLAANKAIYDAPYWCDPTYGEGAFGGAICLTGSASMVVRSSTLADNSTGATVCGGEAIYLTALRPGSQTLDMANTILWGSGAEPIETYGGGASVQISFSDIEGGWPGEGNIDADPMFVDPAAGDYRLTPGSPAADAGANDLVPPDTFDLDGDGDTTEPLPLDLVWNHRFTDDPAAPDTGRGRAPIVDMGAYETVVDGCYPDCDASGGLDFFDFLCFQSAFASGEPYADCDGSGQHDFFDFLCFQTAFAAGCP